ncbi:hypothetical protein [Streptomyces sp. NPDC057889]|uniref:hypothetical protein n=1 Tax=unclassified Streptomyces TaxID=2593676 RepID=UPI0036AD054A
MFEEPGVLDLVGGVGDGATDAAAGSRPPPRPPLERPGSRSDTTTSPARHRPSSTYT